jgi:hypothetical protein
LEESLGSGSVESEMAALRIGIQRELAVCDEIFPFRRRSNGKKIFYEGERGEEHPEHSTL